MRHILNHTDCWQAVTEQGSTSLQETAPRRASGRECAAVVIATCLLFTPFLNKAWHIDDTLFLSAADQIQKSPGLPFDFDYNWFNTPTPMWQATLNPPLQSYYLAGVRQLFGRSEVTAHLFQLLLTVGSALLMLGIARRFCQSPLLVVFISLVTPGYLISLSNVMAENILLFFWLAAIFATIRAADESRPALLWWGGLAGGAATLAKYFGIALVPLLLVYTIVRRRELLAKGQSWIHLAGLLLPVGVLALWCWYSYVQTGTIHPLEAVRFSNDIRFSSYLGNIIRTSNTLIYFSGTLLWSIWLLPLAWLLPIWQRLALVGVTALAALFQQFPTGPVDPSIYSGYELAFYILLLDTALILLLMGLNGAYRRRESASLLLILWGGGTLVFSAYCNWTVNARVVLPALFPTALLVIRWFETLPAAAKCRRWLLMGNVPTLAASLLLATVDYQFANGSRRFVNEQVRPLVEQGATVHISGHWGFQYYLEELGATAIDANRVQLGAGDYIVSEENNRYLERLDVPREKVGTMVVSNPYFIHLISSPSHAGFYANSWGGLPFSYCIEGRLDRFAIWRMLEDVEPEPENPAGPAPDDPFAAKP